MLRLASFDIVFQEVPGEVSLALNISGCPNGCPGCHSPHLQEDTGEILDDCLLTGLLETYGDAVTCVCFMGGDSEPEAVARLAERSKAAHGLKTAWYSGRVDMPPDPGVFDFIKLGPYRSEAGGLDSPTTNQRFYRVVGGMMEDITAVFHKG